MCFVLYCMTLHVVCYPSFSAIMFKKRRFYYNIQIFCDVLVMSLAEDADLAEEEVSDKVHESFTEEDFEEVLGSPTEVFACVLFYILGKK